MIDDLDFAKSPLIPAIVQDSVTRQVLMLGFMNREAVAATLATRRVTFYSRSRQTLWTKGETSGNVLELRAMHMDCDRDTLLVLADPAGPTCHRGTVSCFEQDTLGDRDFLWQLERTIDQRRRAGSPDSYVATLTGKGVARVAQKVGEEGVETALAAATGDRDGLIDEAADLLFHLQMLLRSCDVSLADVVSRLAARAR